MGLFNTLFKAGEPSAAPDSDLPQSREGRNNLRRELVHVVVRDTMRTHGIPNDWLSAMVLPLSGAAARRGLHVLLVVRQGHEQMLAYVPAFQRSFDVALRRFDPRAAEWLLGVSWQFDGMSDQVGAAALPPLQAAGTAAVAAGGAAATANASEAGGVQPPPVAADDDDLEEDLRALFAIRDEALQAPDTGAPHSEFQPTQPLE